MNGSSLQIAVASPTGIAATDTANIQAAFTAITTAGKGKVSLAPGTYMVNPNVLVQPSFCTLEGAGKDVTIIEKASAGVLLSQNAVSASITSSTITGTISSGSNVITSVSSFSGVFYGVPISGTGIPSGAFVTATNPGASTITFSPISGATANGSQTITVGPGVTPAGMNQYQYVKNLTLNGGGHSGSLLQAWFNHDADTENLKFYNNGDVGLDIVQQYDTNHHNMFLYYCGSVPSAQGGSGGTNPCLWMRNGPGGNATGASWVQTDEVHFTGHLHIEDFYYGPVLTSQDVNGNTYSPTPFDISIDNLKLETIFCGYSAFLTVSNVARIRVRNFVLSADSFASGVSSSVVGVQWAPLEESSLTHGAMHQSANIINQMVHAFIATTGAHEISGLASDAPGVGTPPGVALINWGTSNPCVFSDLYAGAGTVHAGSTPPWSTQPAYIASPVLASTGGKYFQGQLSVATTATLANGTLRLTTLPLPIPATIEQMFAEFTVAGDVGSVFATAIYGDNGSGYPSALVVPGPIISTGSSNAGSVTTGGTPGVYAGAPVVTTLSGSGLPLSTSSATTALPVAALQVAIPSATTVTIVSGANTQTWTATATVAAGATSIPVSSQIATYAFPSGSYVEAPIVLPAGLYWIGGAVQDVSTTQPTMRTGFFTAAATGSTSLPSTDSIVAGYAQTGVTGALPTTFTATITPSGTTPRVGFEIT